MTAMVIIGLAHQLSTPRDVSAQTAAAEERLLFETVEATCVWTCFPSGGPDTPHDLWTIGADGTDLLNVTRHPAVDTEAQWSPDGSRMVFASDRSGDFDIFVVDADGSGLVQLTNGDGADTSPTWSPNGRRIAFVRGNVRRSYDIFVMRADGTRLRRIAGLTYIWGLDWSPDGSRILFTKRRTSEIDNGRADGNDDIYTIRPDGSELQAVVRTSFDESYPVWSPNGRRIAFNRDICENPGTDSEFCNTDIYTARVAPRRPARRLTASDAMELTPTWSPDGTKIAYTSSAGDPSIGDIFVMNPDGSNKKRLLAKPDSFDYEVDWQPLP